MINWIDNFQIVHEDIIKKSLSRYHFCLKQIFIYERIKQNLNNFIINVLCHEILQFVFMRIPSRLV